MMGASWKPIRPQQGISNMQVNRRTLFSSAIATAATLAAPGIIGLAQEATPGPGSIATPGYGIARVRQHPTAELAQAVYPDVMSRFLPPTAAVPGYAGYIFAFDDADPAVTINITLLADAAAADAANAVAQDYVQGMDPRLMPETPLAEQGEVRIFQVTDRPRTELPPLLTGCHITMRHRMNTPDTDIEGVIAAAADGFGPIIRDMNGYVLYGWMHTDGGRVSFNIWETTAQLEAGNEAVAAFVADNPVITSEGETLVHNGVIGYSDIFGRN